MITERDDDVPPLEDMSEQLRHVKARRIQEKAMKPVSMNGPLTAQKPVKKVELPEPKTAFTGIKKGFFNTATPPKAASAKAKPPQSRNDEVMTFKPKQTKEEALRFDDVQKAMKEQLNLLNKQEWLTPEFLDRIERNPALARAVSDPVFQQATQDMKCDPEKAFKKYSRERPDLVLALREFAGLLGDQLEGMAGQSSGAFMGTSSRGSHPAPPPVPDDLPDHEKELVRKVLEDKEVQEVLRDPKMQKILMTIRTNPPELQRIWTQSDPATREKLGKLLQCGLLSIQN
ncbi:hypothetical protein HDU67_007109 [Dinochytrium kinnereticum]|nr:hypothetical protein HDU67_007109 [Dinochytrium kinnereticum]